jgi:hypothetical protein
MQRSSGLWMLSQCGACSDSNLPVSHQMTVQADLVDSQGMIPGHDFNRIDARAGDQSSQVSTTCTYTRVHCRPLYCIMYMVIYTSCGCRGCSITKVTECCTRYATPRAHRCNGQFVTMDCLLRSQTFKGGR